MKNHLIRRLPIGAEVQPGGVHFRVWAPCSQDVSVLILGERATLPLSPEGNGYFSGLAEVATAGQRYKFRLDSGDYPDPASRFQPEGPDGPSQVVDPGAFRWSDDAWRGVERAGQVLYEMHVGTFTPEGTWHAAAEQLPELSRIGITVIEMMPVADFAGSFGWGYDGVDWFAPTRLYGEPDDFRAFINRAHEAGIGVILDVVYNHFGSEGCYLKNFSRDYFTSRYQCEWGEPINYDGPNSGPVREFAISNAGYWVEEFHIDGLRLDATQQIFDSSQEHVIAQIGRRVRQAAGGRRTCIINENEPQHVNLIQEEADGGFGLDASWNDDFHHSAMVALTGRNEAYYNDYLGKPQEFISMAKYGYLYQGQRYSWQKKGRGTPSLWLEPDRFVCFLQNHDQIANSLSGKRVHQLCDPASFRAMTALLLLAPQTPLLFQGQEFAASSRFLFFAEHGTAKLSEEVREGREEFISQFPSTKALGAALDGIVPDPGDAGTFQRCKLDFSERQRHAEIYRLHCDLLGLRREDPTLRERRRGSLDGAVLCDGSFLLRFFGREEGGDRILIINFGMDLVLDPAPEPLLAPPGGSQWTVLWTSESPDYGGIGNPALEPGEAWRIPARSALLLEAQKVKHASTGRQPGAP